MNGHEILPAVHGMCSGGGRVPVGLSCRCVDQGEVAPLFSVWMRDKRNRGCFGQTLFGHGQSTYKRGYHLSLSLSGPDLRALFVPSRLSRASPRFVIHTTLSRALYAACTYTNTLPANCVLVSFVPYERPFQYPLPTRAKIPFTRENWPFARTSATCSLSSIHHFHDYSDYSDYLCLLLLLILRLFGFSWNKITFPSVLNRKVDRCSRVFWLWRFLTSNLFGFFFYIRYIWKRNDSDGKKDIKEMYFCVW